MKEIIVRVQMCKTGMILSRDIFNDSGIRIIKKDTPLTDSLIDRLSMLYIENVHIAVDDNYVEPKEGNVDAANYKDDSLKKFQTIAEVKENYKKNSAELENVFEDITKGGDISKANDLAVSIIQSTAAVSDILKCMTEIKQADKYLYHHSLNVASVCNLVGEWMNLDDELLKDLVVAGLLHDVGKTRLPEEVFQATTLTPEQKKLFEQHPMIGFRLARAIEGISPRVCEGILMHHEREDGEGFPNRIKSEEISKIAKIISVADIYSTITLDRIYKRADSPFTVFWIFEKSATQKFDASVTNALIHNMAKYYIGERVKLSNGDRGKIIAINEDFVSKPSIELDNGTILNLKDNPEVEVVRMLY